MQAATRRPCSTTSRKDCHASSRRSRRGSHRVQRVRRHVCGKCARASGGRRGAPAGGARPDRPHQGRPHRAGGYGSLTPGQALVGVVNRELARHHGRRRGGTQPRDDTASGDPARRDCGAPARPPPPGKAREDVARDRKKVLAVSADMYRPAAIKQLETVIGQAGADFFPQQQREWPVDIVTRASPGQRPTITMCSSSTPEPAWHRPGDDGRDPRALHAAARPVETFRRRRHAGAGRSQHGQGVPRCRCPDWRDSPSSMAARRRFALVRCVTRDRSADQSSRASAKLGGLEVFIPSVWLATSLGMATSRRWSRRRNAASTSKRARSPRSSRAARASTIRGLPGADRTDAQDGRPVDPDGQTAGAAVGANRAGRGTWIAPSAKCGAWKASSTWR